jgi:hypothetical protein
LGIRDIYEKNDYPKISITAKDIYESKKDFMDIRHDHKNAHFTMGDLRSKSSLAVDKPTNQVYGESALERVAFKQRGISNTYKSSITLGL